MAARTAMVYGCLERGGGIPRTHRRWLGPSLGLPGVPEAEDAHLVGVPGARRVVTEVARAPSRDCAGIVAKRLNRLIGSSTNNPPRSRIGQARQIGHFRAGLTDLPHTPEPHGFDAPPRRRHRPPRRG